MSLAHALMQARANYPAEGLWCLGTTLCISHQCRIITNRAVSNNEARSDAIFVPAIYANRSEANQPQDMWIYKGSALIAKCEGDAKYQNGVRYQVKEITDEDENKHNFEMVAVADDNREIGESFFMTPEDLGSKMRLCCAMTYFSSQARTINGPLRLAQTPHPNFTLRHLIVGLGRGPVSSNIQVE